MHLPADLRHWHLKVSLMAHRCNLEWGAGDLEGCSEAHCLIQLTVQWNAWIETLSACFLVVA